MQVSVETTGALTRKMTIAIPAAEFEGRIAERLRSTASKVSLPGFRRGRVPVKEVERRFGDALRREVASEVVQSSLENAVRNEDLPLVGTPSVELVNVDAGADLEFTATFEVLPEVDLVDLSTLKVRQPKAEVCEEDIDEMVESLRRQRTEWNAVDRPASTDDRVVVDYSVKVDGNVQAGGQNEDFTFVVGASQAAAELDAAVVGMSTGDLRAFPATIQQDTDETASEVEAVGEVTLKAVEAPSLPDLDEAFFLSFGVFGDADGSGGERVDESDGEEQTSEQASTLMDRFRANVRERVTAELDVATRNETRRQVMAALARTHRFEVPGSLLAEELEQERQRMARVMGVPADHAQLPEIATRRAEERIRTRLVVREIVKRESIEADDERIHARIAEVVAAYEEPEDVRNWIYGDETQLQRIELSVLEDQLVEHVLSRAAVESVAASYKDVVAGKAIPEPSETESDPARVVSNDERDAPAGERPADALSETGSKKPRKGLLGRLFGGGES